jgi:hypothetical protein
MRAEEVSSPVSRSVNHPTSRLCRPYALDADKMIGLRGKRVLEVGGTLFRAFVLADLGAARWIGVECLRYYDDIGGRGMPAAI